MTQSYADAGDAARLKNNVRMSETRILFTLEKVADMTLTPFIDDAGVRQSPL